MQEFKIEFIDNEISSCGGLTILKKMFETSGFEQLLSTLPMPAQSSNRAYSPEQLIIQFMASL